MDNGRSKKFDSVYTSKIKAGKRRTYFFDVKKTKGEDFYVTLTESTKKYQGEGYERHKIFLYKEDFNRFLQGLQETIDYVKLELMPDYDYDEFQRRHEEYESTYGEGSGSTGSYTSSKNAPKAENITKSEDKTEEPPSIESLDVDGEEDMSW